MTQSASDSEAPQPGGGRQQSVEYTVVARRYRPQTFEELIGQQHVARALSQAITTDRVGHAYLFTGARGVGKTSAARVLAKALNCAGGPSPSPCNACDICRGISAGEDVDVLEIDGASNRGIDEIRQLRQNVAVRPSRARFKIYIIDEVHMLTKEAFNALLKTLEEPPEHVKFVFATTEPNKIPITILSRCQRFDFAGIDARSIQSRLTQIAQAEGAGIDAAAAQIIANRAAGSMRDSQSLLEQLLSVADQVITTEDVNSLLGIAPAERLSKLVGHLADRDGASALAELDAALSGGVEVGQLLDQLVGYFRDVMSACVGCRPELMLYALPSQSAQIAELAQQLGIQHVLAILQILDETAARLRVSVHGRILVEMAVVRICNLEDLHDLAELITQLRDPEGSPAVSPPSTRRTTMGSRQAEPSQEQTATASGSNRPTIPPVAEVAADSAHDEPPAHTPLPADAGPEPVTAAEQQSPEATIDIAALDGPAARKIWEMAAREVGGLVAGFAALTEQVSTRPDRTLVVRFDHGAELAKNQCEHPETLCQLQQAVERLSSPGVSLRFELASSPISESAAAKPPRPSRRQQSAAAADRPFVHRALELFGVSPGGYRYVPPDADN